MAGGDIVENLQEIAHNIPISPLQFSEISKCENSTRSPHPYNSLKFTPPLLHFFLIVYLWKKKKKRNQKIFAA